MTGNGDQTSRKIRDSRRAFLRREAGALSIQLASFVNHADDLGAPIERDDFQTLQRAYQILESYGKGTR